MPITAQTPIAYFCAEYGLDVNLPIYAGGLGVLAGDTLKAAADAKLPLVGVGLLYQGENAIQQINDQGEQIDADLSYDELETGLEPVYLNDKPLFVRIHLTQVNIWAQIWKKTIGETVTLYLLDTENEQNRQAERNITHALYCGTDEEIVKQQMILGIGGVKMLHELGIHPSVYHVNEGRPALLHWQLVRTYMDQHGISFQEAKQMAKKQTVYTNHTLVAAGNKGYPVELIKIYAKYYADKMGISVEELLAEGTTEHPDVFKMTRFALNTSQRANGVSALHSKLSKQAWPEYDWVNISNGVHLPTWQASNLANSNITDQELWLSHLENKKNLEKFVREKTGFGYDPNRLVISWARRIAGYKHLEKLFADIERLRAILAHQEKPCQLLIAGKAHFKDTKGKALLKQVIGYMQRELAGFALFIPNYNLEVAKNLVQGSDLWLNTPEYGMEASGTSGMKALSNGVLNCTVSDGWVPEADWPNMGWVLDHEKVSQDLYQKLEQEITNIYYQRNQHNLPEKWISMMRKSILAAKQFSATRMVKDYQEKLYTAVLNN